MNAGKLGLLSVGLMLSLTACDLLTGGGPTINSFTANPLQRSCRVTVRNLAWSVDSSATSISISGGSPVIGNVTSDSDDQCDCNAYNDDDLYLDG